MRLSDNLIDLELEHIDRILRKIAEDPEPLKIEEQNLNFGKRLKRLPLQVEEQG